MQKRKYFIAGNWKMNGLKHDLSEIGALREGIASDGAVEIAVFPPLTLMAGALEVARGSAIKIGAQDCHTAVSGAFTGDISAAMLKDLGAAAVIVGHSERRALHGETSAVVREKAKAALDAGLLAIICIGETAGERAAGLAEPICVRQGLESVPEGATLENTMIAYEPVWAIGTGVVPTIEDIVHIHAPVRAALQQRFSGAGEGFRILYGGSVSPANANTIFSCAEVDGVLVGGASLKASSFLSIIMAAQTAAKPVGAP